MNPALIVNADDLGRSVAETDAALEGHARGAITSASAMVFMEDSRRAADRARAAGLSTGLHLNLSEPFSAAGVAPDLRTRHQRVCGFLRSNRYALVVLNPWLMRDFDYVVKAQLDEFTSLFSRAPDHVDGHQHMHLATNVLWQRLLPEGMRVRRSFSFEPGARHALNLAYRRRVDAVLARRHTLTDRFYSLSSHMDPARLTALCRSALTLNVELMVHPARAHEHQLLMSEEFARLLVETRGAARDGQPKTQVRPQAARGEVGGLA